MKLFRCKSIHGLTPAVIKGPGNINLCWELHLQASCNRWWAGSAEIENGDINPSPCLIGCPSLNIWQKCILGGNHPSLHACISSSAPPHHQPPPVTSCINPLGSLSHPTPQSPPLSLRSLLFLPVIESNTTLPLACLHSRVWGILCSFLSQPKTWQGYVTAELHYCFICIGTWTSGDSSRFSEEMKKGCHTSSSLFELESH